MASLSIDGVVQAEYGYDHLGRQAVRRLTQENTTIHSVFDQGGRRIAEYAHDPLSGASALLREYLWAADHLVGVFEGGALFLVRTDHIGRPVLATEVNGTVQWRAHYLPFGGVRLTTGALPDLRFPGQWFQAEGGLHQNWMRDYDPALGRYLQADPLGLVDGASVYGYALQNPGRWTDPYGLQSEGAGPMGGNPNSPKGRIPGGPWKWSPDPGNSRGGQWTNDRGGSASWDEPGSHWDVHDCSGAKRERYDRWGNKITSLDPHDYEKRRMPRVSPFRIPVAPFLYLPPSFLCRCDPDEVA